MAERIVQPALVPSTKEIAALTTDFLGSMGTFFDMVRLEISKANSTDFDGIEFLVNGASAQAWNFGRAIGLKGWSEKAVPPAPDSEPAKLSESDLERIARDIGEVTCLINSIRNLAKKITKVDVAGIEALCEKAGFMSDRCAEAMGEIPFCGSLEKWAQVEWPEAQVTA